jgi:hypothetical protein
MRARFLLLALSCCLAGCASVPPSDAVVRSVVAHFTVNGFPSESTVSALGLFPDERLGHVVNVNSGVFWYSRDDHFSIEFEVEGCPNSGDPAVIGVMFWSSRSSRSEAAGDILRWLAAAGAPTMPAPSVSDEQQHKWFESTWSKGGHTVHVKAWVAHTESGWGATLRVYPREVVMVY